MTELELLKLIKQGESQTVSLKSLKTKPTVLARSIVSFSNTNNGLLIIGIDDKTRKICGAKTVKEREECLDNIRRAAQQCCEPKVDIPKIDEIETSDGIVFITHITKNPDEVCVTDGTVLVRKGTMDIRPSNYEIQLLFSKRNKLRFEEEAVEDASIKDIDLNRIAKFRREYFKNRKKTLSGKDMDILKQFGCIKKAGKKDIPTVAGILCFGKISRKEYVNLTGISFRQANKDLKDLLDKRLIVQIGKGRSVKYAMHD